MEKATKENHYLYNKKLRPLGKALRGNMTKAEACLWKYVLRAGLLKGYTFNRQRAIKNYIVDFFCKKLHLVIEVDGITHDSEAVQRKDNDKERELTDAGFTVIRFTDDEVLNNIDGVRQLLEDYVEVFEKKLKRLPLYFPLSRRDPP